MTSYTDIKVRYAETDQMGIVHHSVYAIWFEAARNDFLNKQDFTYSDIEKAGFYLPVAELFCKFRKPAHYEDIVTVGAKITKMTAVKLVFEYEIRNKKTNELLVTVSTTHAWTDKTPKLVNIAKAAPEIYNMLAGLMEK